MHNSNFCFTPEVEALAGTLKAAKRRKVITYNSELLLQGAHDNVDIVLLSVSTHKSASIGFLEWTADMTCQD